jgi:hypothetical protein
MIEPNRNIPAVEPHLSVNEVAELWGLSPNTIRKLFQDEPDVFKLLRPKTRGKRAYLSLRIPLSVVERVHRRMCAPAAEPKALKGLARKTPPRIIRLRDLVK